MENQEQDQIAEEQRQRAEVNRAGALAKRKAILSLSEKAEDGALFNCGKLSYDATLTVAKQPFTSDPTGPCQSPEKFRARLEICSPIPSPSTLSPSRVLSFPVKMFALRGSETVS